MNVRANEPAPAADAARPRRRAVTLPLQRRDSIGRHYHVLTFESAEPIPVRAGQFAMIRSTTWGDAPLLPRPMSLLEGGNRPSILIKVVGEGTRRMAHAGGGELFDLLLPLGRPFRPCPPGSRPILVAGGVGVAPLVFLARELAAAGAAKPIVVYGGRGHGDLPLHEELAALGRLEITTEDGSRGTRGRVPVVLDPLLADLARRGEAAFVYTCGPDRMMAAVAELAERHGFGCEAALETPMACGYGVCLGCPVPKRSGGFLYACTEGPCVDAKDVAWHADPTVAKGAP